MAIEFEIAAKKFTDKIIELCATDVACIDGDDCLPLTQKSMRATLIAIRNNILLLENAIERHIDCKPTCRREPVDS